MRVPFLDLASPPDLEQLVAAVGGVLDRGALILGPEVAAFEEEFAAYCGVAHCRGVNSGLDALTLALQALGVGPGDEVLVPAMTFIATWLSVSATGATPVPVDVDSRTRNLDAGLVDGHVTDRTRACVFVHLYGSTAGFDDVAAAARARGLVVVEDAAQAHGARCVSGPMAGALGDAAAFSFYPTKNLGALGDGGGVTTSSADIADRVALLRNYGSRVKYEHLERGGNSRLDEVQAAMLRVRLPRLESSVERRRVLAARYTERLDGQAGITAPAPDDGASWYAYVVEVDDADAVAARLGEAGVGTMRYYPTAPHQTPAYRDAMHPGARYPVATRLAERNLALPLHERLEEAQQDEVLAQLLAAASS
jgi:dTDP-3-amino-3,4,6-trideoxy-alpha-D-glucose transaminase